MYKFSKFAAGSVIAVAAAVGGTSAVLADGYTPARRVAYERPSDWSGFYFGLSSGYQWSNIDTAAASNPAVGFSNSYDSAIVGGHIGLQHQFGSVVLGVEGNLITTFREKGEVVTCPTPSFTCVTTLEDMLTIGGRVGWAAGHWMPYVTGGYANGAFTYRGSTNAVTPVGYDEARSRNNGWYIGGGVEWIVSPGWTAGIEYRHYEFDDNVTSPYCLTATCSGGAGPSVPIRVDASTDSVTARVSWKFGREAPAPLK